MCRHCARHRDMMVTGQTWNSSKGVEQRGKHKIPRVTKIPGVENATKDTPQLSEGDRGSFEAEKAALCVTARQS